MDYTSWTRIQSVCNQYDKIFLVSGDVKEILNLENVYSIELIGDINLKCKENPIGIYSVESRSKSEPV